MTVFDRLGGEQAVARAVDAFYDRMLGDPRLSDWFDGVDLERLKAHQRAFLTVALGGPEEYEGRSMRQAHSGLAISDDAYTRTVEHLSSVLVELGASFDLVEDVSRRMELMRAAIVAPPGAGN